MEESVGGVDSVSANLMDYLNICLLLFFNHCEIRKRKIFLNVPLFKNLNLSKKV